MGKTQVTVASSLPLVGLGDRYVILGGMHRRKLQNNKKAQNQNQTPKKPRAAVMKQQFYSSLPLQAVSRPLQGHFGHSTGLGKCSSSWQQGGRGTSPPGSCETTLSLVQNLTDLVHLVLQTQLHEGGLAPKPSAASWLLLEETGRSQTQAQRSPITF